MIVKKKCIMHKVLTNTFLTTSSFFVSFSTSPADLSLIWTMTAITRNTMTGTVRKICMAAHIPYCLSLCHRRLKREAKTISSSLLFSVVSSSHCCLPHCCQSFTVCLQCCLPLPSTQELPRHSHTFVVCANMYIYMSCFYELNTLVVNMSI